MLFNSHENTKEMTCSTYVKKGKSVPRGVDLYLAGHGRQLKQTGKRS